MSGGGKGGSQSTKAEIPPWAEAAMKQNLSRARDMAQIGYQGYHGPDVAAFSPMQELGMQSSYDAAAAYGLAPQGGNAMAGMPQAQEFEGGIRGYSSGDLYEQARAEFESRNPAQAQQYNQLFVPTGNQENAQQQAYGIPYTDAYGNQQIYRHGQYDPSTNYYIR